MYYLLNKESVINGQPIIIVKSEEKILYSLKNDSVVEFEGGFVPSFIGIKDGVAVETDLYDYFKRGLYKLAYGEYDDGVSIQHYNPIMEKIVNNSKIQKTNEELKLEGFLSLEDGDFISNNSIKNIHSFEIPTGTVKPMFDYDQLKWIETATPEEIEENVWRESVKFYNEELEFATKAVAELKCGIVSQEDFEGVKTYLQSIDPYRKQKTRSLLKVDRPEVFERYL